MWPAGERVGITVGRGSATPSRPLKTLECHRILFSFASCYTVYIMFQGAKQQLSEVIAGKSADMKSKAETDALLNKELRRHGFTCLQEIVRTPPLWHRATCSYVPTPAMSARFSAPRKT